MKINEFIKESTTAGAIATVATPMTTQSRNASIYGGKKGGNLLTGKKTNEKYANRISESKMKQVAMDLENMQDGNFKQKYGKTKDQIKMLLGDPQTKKPTMHEAEGSKKFTVTYFNPKLDRNITKTVTAENEEAVWDMCANKGYDVVSVKAKLSEAHLEEDDLILVPGQGHKLKSGFIPHDLDRRDHEVEMAKSDLFSAAKNAKQVYEMIQDVSEDEGLEGWVQEKIIKANDYLNTVREYLEGKELQKHETGVIAGGAGNFEEEAKGLWANIHAKRERIKKGSGERMRKPGSKGAPTAQNFRDAAK